MKTFLKIIIYLFLAVILTLGLYLGYLHYMSGKPFELKGNIQLFKAGEDKWRPLQEGYRLKDGDAVRTGDDSSCSVTLGNLSESMIKVEENSEVKINDKGPVDLDLVDGKLLATLTRPSKIKTFKVKIPVGVCGVRGTGWQVSADKGSDSAVIEVFEGRVKYGENEKFYETDPYITGSGSKLLIHGSKNIDEKFVYDKLDENKYPTWNKWLKRSENRLNDVKVLNQIAESEPDPYPAWQEGVCYVSWKSDGYTSLESNMSIRKAEADLNPSWINIGVTWYQKDIHSTELYMHPEKTPTDESLYYVIGEARKLGLHIMITPIVDLENVYSDEWRANIGYDNDEDWDTWFAYYTDMVLHYAGIAEMKRVEQLNIGLELTRTTLERPDKWIELIGKVREVYSGKIIYTANWYEEFEYITFWKQLDYAGISAYFPLTKKTNPSYSEIKKNWGIWYDKIEKWQKTHGRPVIFPEIGYKSCQGSAKRPWGHYAEGPVDLKQQANCYKAALETFWNADWFYGMYWWVWRDTNPMMVGQYDRDYTPNDKLSSSIVSKWYAKPNPHKYKSYWEMFREKFGYR